MRCHFLVVGISLAVYSTLNISVVSQTLIRTNEYARCDVPTEFLDNLVKQQLHLRTNLENEIVEVSQELQTHRRRLRNSERRIRNVRREVETIKADRETAKTNRVAFSAYVGVDTESNPVVFDIVQLNEGGGYDNTSGVFIAPVSGTYVIVWTIEAFDSEDVGAQLFVDEEVKGHTWSDASTDNYDSSTGVVILQLTTGRRVYVRLQMGTQVDALQSSFSGWLLMPSYNYIS